MAIKVSGGNPPTNSLSFSEIENEFYMKQTIRDVLDDMSNSQVNLESSVARETISSLISVALKTKGFYT